MTYVYTHGFRSSLNSQTYHRICNGIGIAPLQLVYENGGMFMDNILSLASQLETHLKRLDSEIYDCISHSLGAFYLWQLALFMPSLAPQIKLPLPRRLILFNPVFEPLAQLQAYIDKPQPNYTTNTPFTLTQKAWESYIKAQISQKLENVELIVYLAHDDERINHKLSRPYWEQHGKVIECHGGHSIEDFSPFCREILQN